MYSWSNGEGIHFSVDDTIGSFRWLTKNQETVNSIFDSLIFAFAKRLHEVYGITVTFYCMNSDGCGFSLTEVPDRWKDEFLKNATWLKFGFHSYTPMSNYKNVLYSDFEEEYIQTVSEIKRITGGESLTDVLRIHYFAGSADVIKVLAKNGIRALLCADDDRGSYCLDSFYEEVLKDRGYFEDETLNCTFFPTHVRIENMDTIENSVKKLNEKKKPYVIFTHEHYLAQEIYCNKIIELLDELLVKGAIG